MKTNGAILTLQRLCSILGIDDPDDWIDKIHWFDTDDERDDAYIRYCRAVEATAEKMLAEHSLMLVVVSAERYEFRLRPVVSWTLACGRIMDTVNGKGPFYFSNVRDFIEANDGSKRDTVLDHLGYVKHHPAVYGGPSIQAQIERHMR